MATKQAKRPAKRPGQAPLARSRQLAKRLDAARAGIDLDLELLIAASGGDVERCRAALAHGARPRRIALARDELAALAANDRDAIASIGMITHGSSPLFEAARKGHAPVVELLAGRGRPADGAERAVPARVASLVDVNERDGDGNTALCLAALSRRGGAMRALLAAGADPNLAGDFGMGPLHHGAARGLSRGCRWLLEAGAALEARDSQGWTPLMAAAHAQKPACVGLLLEAGASLDAVDERGRGALDLALHSGAGVAPWQKAAVEATRQRLATALAARAAREEAERIAAAIGDRSSGQRQAAEGMDDALLPPLWRPPQRAGQRGAPRL